MRKFFFSILLLLFTPMWAEDINSMLLHLSSGEKIVFMFENQPVVTFKNEDLVITTLKNVVSYQSDDVLKFTYKYIDPASIDQVETPQNVFRIKGNSMFITGLPPESKVLLYSIDGKLVISTESDNRGHASVVLPDQADKVYIVKTSVANFKITKP